MANVPSSVRKQLFTDASIIEIHTVCSSADTVGLRSELQSSFENIYMPNHGTILAGKSEAFIDFFNAFLACENSTQTAALEVNVMHSTALSASEKLLFQNAIGIFDASAVYWPSAITNWQILIGTTSYPYVQDIVDIALIDAEAFMESHEACWYCPNWVHGAYAAYVSAEAAL